MGPVSSTDLARRSELLGKAQAGDTGALHELIDEFSPLLWHVARAQGVDRETAADTVQTTWLRLLGSLSTIRQPEALAGWLVITTKREAWRVRSNGRRELPADREWDAAPDDSAASAELLDERIDATTQQRVLWRAVQRLSARCRSMVRIVAFVDRPDYTAISQVLGLPHGSIGPTRGRCLAKLREMLIADPAWNDRVE